LNKENRGAQTLATASRLEIRHTAACEISKVLLNRTVYHKWN